jgi:RHS repeat-associated protein
VKVSEATNFGTIYGPFGTYVAGDVFKVAVVGGTVKYYKNGMVFYTSTSTAKYPLRMQASLSDTSSKVVAAYMCASSAGAVVAPPITWASKVNVTTTGSTIKKTSGADGAWNAGVISSQSAASGAVYVQAVADSTSTWTMFGLDRTNSNTSWEDIDYAVYLAGGQVKATESKNSGTIYGPFGTYVAGDVFKVAVENNVVKYSKNNTVYFTSTVAPVYPLHFDSSISDLNARINSAVFCTGSCTPVGATSTTRLYDNAGQLTNQTTKQGSQVTNNATFTYDADGNRTTEHDNVNGGTTTFTFNAANVMTTYNDGHEVKYRYNGDGLRMNKADSFLQGPITYTWDLAGIQGADGLPLLLQEEFPQQDGLTGYYTNNYTYVPGGQLLTRELLATLCEPGDPSQLVSTCPGGGGAAPAPGAPGAEGSLDQQMAAASALESGNYYHADALGNILFLGDSFGNLKATYDYDAYGRQVCTKPATEPCDGTTPFGYTGQYHDSENDMVYLRARYYDPFTQQFISRDPLEGTTGQPYAYAYGNPVNFVDPAGLEGGFWGDELPTSGAGAAYGGLESGSFLGALPAGRRGVIQNPHMLTEEELMTATYLVSNGVRDIDPVARSNTKRTPDVKVDGVLTELKALDPGAKNNSVRNTVRRSMRNGGQARNMVIDARSSGLTEQNAWRGLAQVRGLYRGRLDSIRLIGDAYDIIYTDFAP